MIEIYAINVIAEVTIVTIVTTAILLRSEKRDIELTKRAYGNSGHG